MGVSTDGQICYGIAFEEGFEFPWDSYDSIEDWWICGVHKFKHSFEIYDESGEYIGGEHPSWQVVEEYWQEKSKFAVNHPLPVELVPHCSYDCPLYILAAKGSTLRASRGYPEEFHVSCLVSDEAKRALLKFCEDFNIEYEKGPGWLLSSMWG